MFFFQKQFYITLKYTLNYHIINLILDEKMEFTVPSGCFCGLFTEDWNISIVAFAEASRIDERLYTQQVLTLSKPVLSIKKVSFFLNKKKIPFNKTKYCRILHIYLGIFLFTNFA